MPCRDVAHPRRVVVAYDASKAARAALDWAARTVADETAGLLIVHVIDMAENAGVPTGIQEGADALVAAAAARAAELGVPEPAISTLVAQGRPWEAVVEAAEGDGVLLVVGRRGDGVHHRHPFGRTPDRVARMARTPVLIVPADGFAGDHGIRRAVVGIDHSEDSNAAVCAASALVGPGGTVIGVHACPPPIVVTDGPVTPLPDVDMDGLLGDARAGVASRLADLLPDDREAVAVASPLYPVHALEDAARDHAADLVAVGTRGRTGLSRLLLGSVAERTLQHMPCPTLVVHGGDLGD